MKHLTVTTRASATIEEKWEYLVPDGFDEAVAQETLDWMHDPKVQFIRCTDETVGDEDDRIIRSVEATSTWRVGRCTPTGDDIEDYTVLGQWDDANRWNGFLSPGIDPLGVEKVLAAVNGDPGYYTDYGIDYRWAESRDGVWCLVTVDRTYLEDPTYPADVLEPDADGLFYLGAWSWCWGALDNDDDESEPTP